MEFGEHRTQPSSRHARFKDLGDCDVKSERVGIGAGCGLRKDALERLNANRYLELIWEEKATYTTEKSALKFIHRSQHKQTHLKKAYYVETHKSISDNFYLKMIAIETYISTGV